MNKMSDVQSFLDEKKIAVAGASRSGKKFGNSVLRDLSKIGWELFPVNPNAGELEGMKCCKNVSELPDEVNALYISVPGEQTEFLVQEAVGKGIKKIWIQQGASSPNAVQFCKDNDMTLINNECIFMFANPKGIHGFHRFLWKVFGKLPK